MILITGGTGTSGVPLLQQLSARGVKFRALARTPAKIVSLRLPEIEIAQGDLADPPSLAAALAGVDRIFLEQRPDPRQVDLQGNLVTAAKAAGVKHIVKFSAMGAATLSPARFLRWHGQTEDQIKASGIPWTFLRPTFFLQNLLGLASMAKHGHIYQPAADGRAAFVDVRDIAAVAVKTLTEPGHEGKTYNLTGPEALSYHHVAAALTDVLRKEVQYVDVPPGAAKQGMLETGMPEWLADGINELFAMMAAGKFAIVSTAVADVARRPPTGLTQFVKDYAEAFRSAK